MRRYSACDKKSAAPSTIREAEIECDPPRRRGGTKAEQFLAIGNSSATTNGAALHENGFVCVIVLVRMSCFLVVVSLQRLLLYFWIISYKDDPNASVAVGNARSIVEKKMQLARHTRTLAS